MKRTSVFLVVFGAVLIALLLPTISAAEVFRITVMQDQKGAAQKYGPLRDYLAKKGITVTFVEARDYPAATSLFVSNEVDAMFSGSGIAGVLLLKNVATPLVRPVDRQNHSTYWAAVIAPKGSPKFTHSGEYFKGKRVAYTSLASSGEFYYRALLDGAPVNATVIKASSHGDAIETLNSGKADIAIVKNRVWDDTQTKYPNLVKVGEDKGVNPDNTLIVSKNMPASLRDKISEILLALHKDPSAEAQAVMRSLNIQGFIKTTYNDFEHTLSLLSRAGATKSFNFAY